MVDATLKSIYPDDGLIGGGGAQRVNLRNLYGDYGKLRGKKEEELGKRVKAVNQLFENVNTEPAVEGAKLANDDDDDKDGKTDDDTGSEEEESDGEEGGGDGATQITKFFERPGVASNDGKNLFIELGGDQAQWGDAGNLNAALEATNAPPLLFLKKLLENVKGDDIPAKLSAIAAMTEEEMRRLHDAAPATSGEAAVEKTRDDVAVEFLNEYEKIYRRDKLEIDSLRKKLLSTLRQQNRDFDITDKKNLYEVVEVLGHIVGDFAKGTEKEVPKKDADIEITWGDFDKLAEEEAKVISTINDPDDPDHGPRYNEAKRAAGEKVLAVTFENVDTTFKAKLIYITLMKKLMTDDRPNATARLEQPVDPDAERDAKEEGIVMNRMKEYLKKDETFLDKAENSMGLYMNLIGGAGTGKKFWKMFIPMNEYHENENMRKSKILEPSDEEGGVDQEILCKPV